MTWLQPEEQRAWVGLLASVAAIDYACDRQLQRDSSVSFASYTILAAVSDGPDQGRRLFELVGITGHSQSRLSHAVTRLEADGLVVRRRGSPDRRAVHVCLTDAGRRLLAEAAPGHVAEVRRLVFDHLTPAQVTTLAEITRGLYDVLSHEGHVPPFPA